MDCRSKLQLLPKIVLLYGDYLTNYKNYWILTFLQFCYVCNTAFISAGIEWRSSRPVRYDKSQRMYLENIGTGSLEWSTILFSSCHLLGREFWGRYTHLCIYTCLRTSEAYRARPFVWSPREAGAVSLRDCRLAVTLHPRCTICPIQSPVISFSYCTSQQLSPQLYLKTSVKWNICWKMRKMSANAALCQGVGFNLSGSKEILSYKRKQKTFKYVYIFIKLVVFG
jgi:hypothetical protein